MQRAIPISADFTSCCPKRDRHSSAMFLPTNKLLYLRFPRDYLYTVDQTVLWRKNLIWSKRDGKDLLCVLLQQLVSHSVLICLLLGSDIFLFVAVPKVWDALSGTEFLTLHFWAGITWITSILVHIATIYVNLSAWGILSAVSPANVHAITRSSMGLYALQLPGRFTILSVYTLGSSLAALLFIVLNFYIALGMTVGFVVFVIHVNSVYSAMGHIVMESGAMAETTILSEGDEESMCSKTLLVEMERRISWAREANIGLRDKYRSDYQALLWRVERDRQKEELIQREERALPAPEGQPAQRQNRGRQPIAIAHYDASTLTS